MSATLHVFLRKKSSVNEHPTQQYIATKLQCHMQVFILLNLGLAEESTNAQAGSNQICFLAVILHIHSNLSDIAPDSSHTDPSSSVALTTCFIGKVS